MNCINKSKLELMDRIRSLWEQHGTWTFMAITAIVFQLPNEQSVLDRLLRNPKDFRRALGPYYGEALAKTFETLLTEHLTLAADLINAMRVGENAKASEIEKRWFRNAEEIAIFLSSINPFWSRIAWKRMFFEHLDFIMEISLDLIKGNFPASIRVSDLFSDEILEMAHTMSQGIIRQFPKKFR